MDTSFIDVQNHITPDQLATDSMTKETKNKISEMYEQESEYLKLRLNRIDNHPKTGSSFEWHLSNKILNESEERQAFFDHLREEFIQFDSLVSEANTISNEMEQETTYNVFLQIPVSYLKPSERTITNLCEPAVQVKRHDFLPQIWDREKFESKLYDMRDVYRKWQTAENKAVLLTQQFKRKNPFFDDKESNCFIGVANIYLQALVHDSKLDYTVSIINTQGEISGTLHAVLDQTGSSSMKKLSNFQINSTARSSRSEGISIDADEETNNIHTINQVNLQDEAIDENGQINIKFSIKEVRNLPQSDADHIMCRYTFINPKLDQTVISVKSSDDDNPENKSRVFSFDHENEYIFPIADQFLSACCKSSVSIEVWYRYKNIPQSINTTVDNDEHKRHIAEAKKLGKWWKEVKRFIQFSIEIHELDGSGQWKPVEVDVQQQIISGGVYRLKQGQSKRIKACVHVLPAPGTMLFEPNTIQSIEIGSINTRKINAPRQLDSYQDEELQGLRQEWLNKIEKRKLYLESEVNKLNEQTDKTPNDIKRETSFLEQLVRLAEERDIAVFPPVDSGIPGSPPGWTPPPTIENHRPLICLNVDPINMNKTTNTAGNEATLNEENKDAMFKLPIIQHVHDEVSAIAQWNPSIHDAASVNQVTSNETLIYMIVKITVIIVQPVRMELVLRKRIAVTIGKAENWWSGKKVKSLFGYKTFKRTSVVYEIVSSLPKYIYNIDDRENVGLINASDLLSQDSIEKYIQYASNVDSLLLADKLRQDVLLAENYEKRQTIRKVASASNMTDGKQNTDLLILPEKSQDKIVDISETAIQPPTIEPPPKQIADNNNENYLIGSQVIVNTDHVFNKLGTIQFIGKICIKRGLWYGIELNEAVGKNNGSLDGNVYFQCLDKHGVFVRRDKLGLVN